MRKKLRTTLLSVFVCSALVLTAFGLMAAEHHGQVKFGTLPVPGVTVTATQGDKKLTAITDEMGTYFFPDLADGNWTMEVTMLGFAPIKQDVVIATAPNTAGPDFELKMLALADMKTETAAPVVTGVSTAAPSTTTASETPTPAPAKPAARNA